MKSIIIGTAGHIDHGKTSLVKALTGIDADRLAEEKRRGITIDLGFAHMELPIANGEALRIGFVDVPGHERFVRNMLAGVGGIDLVLLVIAADESIKPQTREHFEILQLLGVKHGVTVLTKADAVDAETLDVVRMEIEEFLAGTFLAPPNCPIIAVSSLTGAGLDDLKRAIIVSSVKIPARDSHALPRLPIDRVFTMKGFGSVVTGTLIAGTIRREDELESYPTGKRVRVRGIQVHGNASEQAIAGQRTALNLAGVSVEELSRGMTLAPPETFIATRSVDASLRLLPLAPRPLKNRSRVHFHCYSSETVAQVELYDRKELKPSETAFARLSLANPLLVLPEDRFILRQFSPVLTIGGAVIVDAIPNLSPREMKRVTRASGISVADLFLEPLAAFERRETIFATRVARRGQQGLSLAQAVAETGWSKDEVATRAANGPSILIQEKLFAKSELDLAQQSLLSELADFHKREPLKPGMSGSELQDEITRAVEMAKELFEAAISALLNSKKVEIAGELVRLPGRGTELKDEEAESKKKIEDAFAAAGLRAPELSEVLACLTVDRVRAQKLVTLLLRDKTLVKISDNLVFHRTALDQLRAAIAGYRKKSTKIDVASFKKLTGVSRKYAIPLLEYLDRERVTRRVGDVREIF